MSGILAKSLNRAGAGASAMLVVLVVLLGAATPAAAQPVAFGGQVVDARGLALPGVTIEVRRQNRVFVTSTVSDRTGRFRVSVPVPGDYMVVATLIGFERYQENVSILQDSDQHAIRLELGVFTEEVSVLAGAPEMATEFALPAQQIEKRVAQDVAASLRAVPGVTSLRRGAINLDPSVRGLYAEQLGVFVDGTRTFAAGPARMDSALSHISPHALQSLRVVKGPYALTWGAGALSAVRADTFRPAFSPGAPRVGGRSGYNFGGNGSVHDAFAGLWGSTDRLRFAVQHNTRTGDDYEDGDGRTIPGGYESFDTRWDVGGRPSEQVLVEYSGGYQKQNDIDYPGRILDATFFSTQSHAVDVSYASPAGIVHEVAGQVYVNNKDHLMNNEAKPTAMDMPDRKPPFGLDIDLPASSETLGGRFHVRLAAGVLQYAVGVDFYRLSQTATRTISRRSDGTVLFTDAVWPDATITSVGGYGQVIYGDGRTTMAATVRVDGERARVGEASAFFLANTTGDLEQDNSDVSAAASASIRVTDNLLLNVGAGRAVRNPSVLERYSDRFPAVKFQTAAEFMGNPSLVPEKSLEFTIGTVARLGTATVQGDFFHRTIHDYITVVPDPDLPKRLPLSPPVVFRYVQEDGAVFTGVDLEVSSGIGSWVDVRGAWSYVRATDQFFDEPLFGIAPFEQRYTAQLHSQDLGRWVELVLTATADQKRVAAARLERPTDGWTTIDVQAGWDLARGVSLRGGILNLTDASFANHLNSFNPFSGERIAEVGRRAYVGMEFAF